MSLMLRVILLETAPESVQRFAPEISFSKDERYFPCPLFFDGVDILRNREKYEALTLPQKKDLISCYYHVTRDKKHTAYEYWYYYVYNDYSGGHMLFLRDVHDHDMEFAIVYVSNSSEKVVALALNQHHWLNWVWPNGIVPRVFAEDGGHGLFRKKADDDVWKAGGLTQRVEPKESVESLRMKFVDPEPNNLMNEDGTLNGEVANYAGRWAKPKVPWVRAAEYTFPISHHLAEAERNRVRMLSVAPYTKAYPEEITLSIPYDKSTRKENLDEALKLGLISEQQYGALL